MNYKRLSFILSFLLFFIIGVFIYIIVRTDNNDTIPPFKTYSEVDTFNLRPYVQSIPKDSLIQKFPYNKYLVSANYGNVMYIQRDLSILDSFFTDNNNNQRVLSIALTDSLLKMYDGKFNNYLPDSLIRLKQWTERFKFYSEADPKNEPLYSSIHSYWMDFIANSLARYSRQNPKIKYDFKFKYLVAECAERKYATPIKVTYLEKIIYNVLGNHWSHLFEASWNQASFTQIIVLTFILLFIIYSVVIVIRSILKLIKKEKK